MPSASNLSPGAPSTHVNRSDSTFVRRRSFRGCSRPSIASPLVRLVRGRHRHFDTDHFWFFSPATLQRFVRDHGFTVKECYSPTRRLSIGWIRGILSRYLPRKVGTGLVRAVRATHLSEQVVGVNVRDIVLVIAEKTG